MVPGITTGCNISAGMPRSPSIPVQVRVRLSSIWLVEAMVYLTALCPLSQ